MDGERNLKTWVTVSAFIVLGLVSRATATDIHWTGAAVESNSWCEPNNWAGAVVPGASDNAVIDVPGDPNAQIEPDCSAMCNRLTVGQTTGNCRLDIIGGNLAVTTDFVIGDQNDSNGIVTITAGSVDVSGLLDIAPDGAGHVQLDGGTVNAGELIMDTNASMDITGGTLIIDGYALDDVWAYVDAGLLTGYGSAKGVVADFDQSNLYKTTVTANAGFDPDQAWNPRPPDGAIDVASPVILQWDLGQSMGSRGRQAVYLGTDPISVFDATVGDPEFQDLLGSDPPEWNAGNLAFLTTFYWRIDEYNDGGSLTKGNVWGFTTEHEADIYVDEGAGGANNGSSWTDAYNYLQDALADPCLALTGGAICVAEGTYEPDESNAVPDGTGLRTDTFALISGVAIYGGFPAGGGYWYERDPDSYKTILSGDINTPGDDSDNSYHVVTGSGTEPNAILDGVTITGGNANGIGPNGSGGGMYNHIGSPSLTNCTFIGNSCGDGGGGMANWLDSSPTVINCIFSGNSAAQSGGGMHNSSSSPTVTNCTFSGNSADYGGGMYNYQHAPAVVNCSLSGNSADYGGGVYNDSSDPNITNCILWGNIAPNGADIFNDPTSSPTVTYCDIQGGCEGDGNIDQDPLFKDADGADDIVGTQDDSLELGHDSPCIDAGDSNSVPPDYADLDEDGDAGEQTPLDLAGRARFTDDPVMPDTGAGTPPIVDMGAYERYEFCGDAEHPHPPGDVTGLTGVPDCRINFFDFAVWAAHWLEDTGPE
jgi:hypothetical protein